MLDYLMLMKCNIIKDKAIYNLMGLADGINDGWIPYWYRENKRYKKIQHLDYQRKIKKELDNVFRLGGVIPIMFSYRKIDKIKKEIDLLYLNL